MQQKYGKQGLEVISVSVDDPSDRKTIEGVAQFLDGKLGARFVNLSLDPKSDWQQKVKVNGVPCIYVFNRDNHHVKKLPLLDAKGEEKEEVDYDVIEKVVENLMKK